MKHENLSGQPAVDIGTYSFPRRLGMGLLALIVFLVSMQGAFFLVGKEHWGTLWMLTSHGVCAVLLLLLVLVQFRKDGGLRGLVGHDLMPTFKIGLLLMVNAYLACTILDVGLGFGREDYMVRFLADMTPAEKVLCLVMLVTLPPLNEELLYRHFLIRIFPLNSRFWRWAAVLITSLIFMQMHSQYSHWPTVVLIGAVGLILAFARVRTGGILVPVLLHSSAEVIGMTTDWAIGQWF